MFKQNLLKSGWIHALFIGLIAYPLGAITAKVVISEFHSNVLVYTVIFNISAAVALLIKSGPGHLAIRTIKRPETWIYAIMQIVVIFCGISLMQYVSATEGAGLYRVTGFFTLILSWIFLAQKINKFEFLGALTIFLGFYAIISEANIPIEAKFMLVIFVLGRGIGQSIQKIITETHKANRKATNTKDETRVAGFVMAVSGVLLFIVLLFLTHIKSTYNMIFLEKIPNYSNFLDIKMFTMSVLMGTCIVSISKYCEFYAGKNINARYLASIISLQIVFVYIIEKALAYFGFMKTMDYSSKDYIILGVILLGNLIIAFAGFFKDLKFIKKGEKQDTLANMEGNFIDNEEDFKIAKVNLANILTLYDGDVEHVAENLGTTKMMIDNILHYDLYEVKLSRKLAKKISNFASMNVSLRDKLTKAYNRYYLEQKTKNLFKRDEAFKLYYLDLNKFKPVNDTYGHDAGDEVLIETVERLEIIVKQTGFIVRLGGDEFVVIQLEDLQHDLSAEISESLKRPMNVKSTDKEINISTSIGVCESYDCTNFEEMLQKADANMFKDKNNR